MERTNLPLTFLEPERNDDAAYLVRMYLITEEQLENIRQDEGPTWYDLILDLSMVDGVPVRTFTHSRKFAKRHPRAGNI